MKRVTALTLSALAVVSAVVLARIARQPRTLDATARVEVIDALARELERSYVYLDRARAVAQTIRARLAAGGYDRLADPEEFARTLTGDLQAVTHDKHLRVFASRPRRPGGNAPAMFGETARSDGGVASIEILTFGVSPTEARDLVRDRMSAIADAAALIVDIRRNGGGNPQTVALVSSYLFGDAPVHLNSLYWREADRTDDFFTDPHVEGARFGGSKPIWVLTGARTFSGAEEFAYNLQARKRATIVGETTGGGAHPGGVVDLAQGFSAFVPSGRAINPMTHTNWEGTGVTPDVAVPAAMALDRARALARARE